MTDIDYTGVPTTREPEFSDYVSLLKPRVMSLVIFTALVGLVIAPVGVHPFLAFAALICVAVGAGASGALNMWWDADIDAVMKRTAKRPIPDGRVTPSDALHLGLWLSVLSVVFLGLFANFVAAGLLAFTIFFYAVIYTVWLKRSTPQNIVIGGAAGAFPPMIGWAIATGGVSVESVLMFMLIFLWTPPHFWALSLFMNDDYSRAGVPMMTVTHGRSHTRKLIAVYVAVLVPSAALLAITAVGGWAYALVFLAFNAKLVLGACRILKRSDDDAALDNYVTEKEFFGFTITYLFAHFAALLVDAGLKAAGIAVPWPALI